MKQVYRAHLNLFNRTQIVGKARLLKLDSEQEAFKRLELAAQKLVQEARWAGFMSPINELRRPLLELRLARRKPLTSRSQSV